MPITVPAFVAAQDDITAVATKALDTSAVLTGDLMVVLFEAFNPSALVPPAGWTQIQAGTMVGASLAVKYYAGYKIAQGDAPSESFGLTGTARWGYALAGIRGSDNTPITGVINGANGTDAIVQGNPPGAWPITSLNLALKVETRSSGGAPGATAAISGGTYTALADSAAGVLNLFGPSAAVAKRNNAAAGGPDGNLTWSRVPGPSTGNVSLNVLVGLGGGTGGGSRMLVGVGA